MENVPGLKLVFDTANPVFNEDRSKAQPWPKQDPWEFYEHVKEHVVHVHVKDARWNNAKNDADYTMPGDGDGKVRQILTDLIGSGYSGGISIEPHVAVVFHDSTVKASDEDMFNTFVEYGRKLMLLCDSIEVELKLPSRKRPRTVDGSGIIRGDRARVVNGETSAAQRAGRSDFRVEIPQHVGNRAAGEPLFDAHIDGWRSRRSRAPSHRWVSPLPIRSSRNT